MIRKAVLTLMMLAAASSAYAAATWNAWSGMEVGTDSQSPPAQIAPGVPGTTDPAIGGLKGGLAAESFTAMRPTTTPLPIGQPVPMERGEDPSTTAVPEPGTLTLLALGMLGAGAGFRRRKR